MNRRSLLCLSLPAMAAAQKKGACYEEAVLSIMVALQEFEAELTKAEKKYGPSPATRHLREWLYGKDPRAKEESREVQQEVKEA